MNKQERAQLALTIRQKLDAYRQAEDKGTALKELKEVLQSDTIATKDLYALKLTKDERLELYDIYRKDTAANLKNMEGFLKLSDITMWDVCQITEPGKSSARDKDEVAWLRDRRITVPPKTIPFLYELDQMYGLSAIFQDRWETAGKNVCYNLEQYYLYEFLLKRFDIYGPVETMTFLYCASNLQAGMEGMIRASADNLADACAERKRQGADACRCSGNKEAFNGCPRRVRKKECKNFAHALEELQNRGYLKLDEMDKDMLDNTRDTRNRVHMNSESGNTYMEGIIDVVDVAQAKVVFQTVSERLNKDAVPYYKTCPYRTKK